MFKDEEVWKDMVGYEEYFLISSLGNVYSKRTNKVLKLTKSKTGYLCFATRLEGRGSKCILIRAHRAVAEAFIPIPTYLIEYKHKTYNGKIPVNHKDGNKLNNKLSNLEWVTHEENMFHAVNNGLIPKKDLLENPLFKLTQDQINFIIENYDPKNNRLYGERALSRIIGCGRSSVSKVLMYFKLKQ